MAAPGVMYNWTGFYIGANIGYGWGKAPIRFVSFVDPAPQVGFAPYFARRWQRVPNLKPAGMVGGGQVGYNWQVNQSELGGEG